MNESTSTNKHDVAVARLRRSERIWVRAITALAVAAGVIIRALGS